MEDYIFLRLKRGKRRDCSLSSTSKMMFGNRDTNSTKLHRRGPSSNLRPLRCLAPAAHSCRQCLRSHKLGAQSSLWSQFLIPPPPRLTGAGREKFKLRPCSLTRNSADNSCASDLCSQTRTIIFLLRTRQKHRCTELIFRAQVSSVRRFSISPTLLFLNAPVIPSFMIYDSSRAEEPLRTAVRSLH